MLILTGNALALKGSRFACCFASVTANRHILSDINQGRLSRPRLHGII